MLHEESVRDALMISTNCLERLSFIQRRQSRIQPPRQFWSTQHDEFYLSYPSPPSSAHSARISSLRSSNSASVPSSVMRPPSISRIRSARVRAARR